MLADALPDHYFVSIFALGCAANRGFSFDADFDMLMVDFQNLFGMSLHTFSIYMIFAMILSCLQYLLMVFASGSIGQLFTKHKVGASIGAGIVFYMSGQIVPRSSWYLPDILVS